MRYLFVIILLLCLLGAATGQASQTKDGCKIETSRPFTECQVPDYDCLTQKIREELVSLGVSAQQWNCLSNKQRLGYFNITAAIKSVSISLDGLQVDWDPCKGIQQDRVFFKRTRRFFSESQKKFESLSEDIGKGSEHGDHFISSRQNRFYKSFQVSFDSRRRRVDMDIDIFNPNLNGGYVIGLVLHGIEVGYNKLTNRKTSPYIVSFRPDWVCSTETSQQPPPNNCNPGNCN